ncbi:MAG: long-chain acyl-CoA synthetase [Desulforhopalus sp.]|jgi:long-chain acyl-CoA synthetase
MSIKDYVNYHEMLLETMERYGKKRAFRWFDEEGNATSINWETFYDQVKGVSKSLIALGVEKTQKVNILSYTCYKWVLTDVANMCMGAATVGIYQSNLPVDCEYIINHSDGVLVFAENLTQLEKLIQIRSNIPYVKKVVLFNGEAPDDEWVITYDEFLKLGNDIDDQLFIDRLAEVVADDAAGIVYTSGTTGVPKGVVLTHDNITFTCQSVENSADFSGCEDMFIFLPMAHVFARTCSNGAIKLGHCTSFARSIDSLIDDFSLASPHWFISVPRVFEKMHTKILASAEAKGGATLKIFNWACEVGKEVSICKVEKRPIPFGLSLQYKLATKLVFEKIHKALGGRVKWCISGAAPLNPDIARFFHAAGLLVLEGVGMTENCSFSNINRPDNYRFGVVGPPGKWISHKIGEDGEVLFKGRNVMKEYYKMPEETADTFTEDGWLQTGDIGTIDQDNFLQITDRKKDLIITSGGKNIAPSRIEGNLATSIYFNQICVVGEKRNYLTAVVTLNDLNIMDYADKNSISYKSMADLVENPDIISMVNAEVAEKNKSLASFETIKKVVIVPEFTIENQMMTPTFKLKKKAIIRNHQDLIEKMYGPRTN